MRDTGDMGDENRNGASRGGLRLPPGRRLVGDFLHCARGVPAISFFRAYGVEELAELRAKIHPKPAWAVIFAKAYARVAAEVPELRQHFLRFPTHRLYQNAENVAMFVVPREVRGENCLFLGRLHAPQSRPISELQERYRFFHVAPIGQIRQFRHQYEFVRRIPGPLRRGLLGFANSAYGPWKTKAFGTFGVTISRSRGSRVGNYLTPWTTVLGIDYDAGRGEATTAFTFDHRVFDGLLAVEVLGALAKELEGPILEEMRALAAAG